MRSLSVARCAGIACTLSALLLLDSAGPAAAESAKRREVRELLKLTGADSLGTQVMHQLLASLKGSFPKVPPSYWQKLQKRLDTRELAEQIVPVYERHFDRKDLKGLIAFYKSPLGRRFVSAQPKLVAESMQIGQAWGQKVAQQVVREIQDMK